MSFSLAQVILIALIVGVVAYIFTVRSVSRDRTAMLIIAAAGCVLVIWPGLSTDVAQAVGIGRGTDLLFYLFVVFCLFRFVSTAAEMRRVNERVTRVVRDSALRDARPAPDRARVASVVIAPGGGTSGPAPES
jgi:small membrane protein